MAEAHPTSDPTSPNISTEADGSIGPGDPVKCRCVDGTWFATTARSKPRYDFENAVPKTRPFLSVAVDYPSPGGFVNWPAEHVVRAEAA